MASSKGKGADESAPPAYVATVPGRHHRHENAVIAAADIRARDEVSI